MSLIGWAGQGIRRIESKANGCDVWIYKGCCLRIKQIKEVRNSPKAR